MSLRQRRRARRVAVVLASMVGLPAIGCFDSEIAKRFRDAYAPGLIEGLSTAVLVPGDSETGLRRAFAALFEGLGAVVQTRDAD